MEDDIIDLAARRALKQAASDEEPSSDEEMLGYKIGWSNEGRVMISFVTEEQEYTAVLNHEAARRFYKRVQVATLRAKRCQGSTSSDKS